MEIIATVSVRIALEYCECGCKTSSIREYPLGGKGNPTSTSRGSIEMYALPRTEVLPPRVRVCHWAKSCRGGRHISSTDVPDWNEAQKQADKIVMDHYRDLGYTFSEPAYSDLRAGI